MLRKLKKGDIIIASEISRLGRDLYMVMEILHHCMKAGCIVYTVKDNFVLGDNIQSKVLAFAFGLAAEIERQMIRQRTTESLKRKRSLGILLGRPPGKKSHPSKCKLYGKTDIIAGLLNEGISKMEIAKILKVDRSTIYRYCSNHNIPNRDGSQSTYKTPGPRKSTFRSIGGVRVKLETTIGLPKIQVKEMIISDMTIPEIAAKFPQFSYDEVYDAISFDFEMHTLYRQHAQKRLMAMSPKRQDREGIQN